MNNIFYYIISFIVALLFILVGSVCAMLPWSPEAQQHIAKLVTESTMLIFLFGLGFIIIGLAVTIYIILASKKRTYFVRKGRYSIGIDPKVIDGYLIEYINDLFPNQEASHHLVCRKKGILLTLDLPFRPKPEQEPLTEQIYDDVSEMLSDKVGYNEEIHLAVGFQPPPKEIEV